MKTQTLSASDNNFNSERPENYREINKPFNHVQNALVYGILGGITLGLYQLFLYNSSGEINIGGGLLGFVLLTPFLFFALRTFRNYLAGGEVFKNGIMHGMAISAIASLVMVLISMIGFSWQASPEILASENLMTSQMILNGAFQILVGIVFGMTITFIILQGIKSDIRADKYIDKHK